MKIIYLQRKDDHEHLGLNITNQTTTGWHSSLAKATQLSFTTDRRMADWFSSAADKSLEELLAYLGRQFKEFTIVDIYNDEILNSYEYW